MNTWGCETTWRGTNKWDEFIRNHIDCVKKDHNKSCFINIPDNPSGIILGHSTTCRWLKGQLEHKICVPANRLLSRKKSYMIHSHVEIRPRSLTYFLLKKKILVVRRLCISLRYICYSLLHKTKGCTAFIKLHVHLSNIVRIEQPCNLRKFVCFFIWGFSSITKILLIWKRHHGRWRAANFDLSSALMAIEQWGFLSLPYLLWHGVTVYNGHRWGPVKLTPYAERLAVELSLPVFTT